MWLSLLLVGLILAVTATQAKQGLFSAFIMAVLAICCAAVAFGTHEWVANHWLAPYWKADYALPIALGAMFGVPLVVLRLAFDKLIRRACLLPVLVDRIGGGVCGFFTAMIMVGLVAVCMQMIPFAYGSILGYTRFPVMNRTMQRTPGARPPSPDAKEAELWLSPDRFAVAVASVLSDGIFSGSNNFCLHHPDLVQSIGWSGAAHAEVSRYAPPRSISVVRTKPVAVVYRMTPGDTRNNVPPEYEEQTPKAGHYFQMVRVKLLRAARDVRKSHNFTLRQFRLVGRSAESGQYRQYHPVAIQQVEDDIPNRHIRDKLNSGQPWPVLDEIVAPRDGNDGEVEVVFELPTGFKPAFVEYKREARAAVTFEPAAPTTDARPTSATTERVASRSEPAQEPPAVTPPQRARPAETSTNTRRRRRGGNVRAVTVAHGSRFSDELPLAMRSYRRLNNAEISRSALLTGHLVGEVDQQAGGTNPAVSKFDVPRNKRLLQLNARRLTAGSAFGRALSQAVATVQNYFVTDQRGNRHLIVGKYAVANVRGRKMVEIQYYPGPVGSIGGLGKFDRIDEKNLKPNDEFVLLFLVDPGARIVSFSTGGSATRRDDLTGENLVAPR